MFTNEGRLRGAAHRKLTLQPAYPIENTHEQSLLDAWVIVDTMKKGWL